jgi:mRNA-degrading endonuclease toxin of MazEF toxin-antitoxin module
MGDQTTRVLCEMVGSIDSRVLGEPSGHLTVDEMRAVDEALLLTLDLS